MQALFAKQGDHYIPSESAGSPWGLVSLHGGAPTALMLSAMQEVGVKDLSVPATGLLSLRTDGLGDVQT